MTDSRAAGERLDSAGSIRDDGLQRNWDGQTRQEYLTMLQEPHDKGNVRMDNGSWLVEEDAITEVGVEGAARLRAHVEAFLEEAWAELEAQRKADGAAH